MASVQRKVVHKQFNSPIALYSDTNIKDTLDKELKALGNGVVGINFADPATTRSANLAKSAVLAALEEEENASVKPGLKRVAWPPPPESSYYQEPVEYPQQQQQQQQQWQNQPVQQQQAPTASPVIQTPIRNAPLPSYQTQQQQPRAAMLPQQQQRPVSIHGLSSLQNQYEAPAKPLSPLPMLQTNFSHPSPPQNHAPRQQVSSYVSPRGWAHVKAPRSPGGSYIQPGQFYSNGTQPISPPFVSNVPAYTQENVAQQQQISPPQPQYQQQQYQQPPFQGTPLRKEAPITQKPAPVYQSQPVATTFQGGANRRGDSKWPPENYKQQSEIDNEARRRLALGPAFRPKRVNRDFSGFFAQNALSNTYPGYRVPPGTLHVGYGEFL